MGALLPAVVWLLMIVVIIIAFKKCGWRDMSAFLIAIFLVPAAMFFFPAMYETIVNNKIFDYEGFFAISLILGLVGLPIYFLFVIPIYYRLKRLSISINISFPLSLTVILLVLLALAEPSKIDVPVVLIIAGCSVIHALFILWLIAKFNKIFPMKTI